MAVNKVVIGVEADTKKFDKDINNIKKRLEDLRKKAEEPFETDGTKITGGWNLSEEEQKEYEKLSSIIEEIKEKENEQLQEEIEITKEKQKQNEESKTQLSKSQELYIQINDMLDSLKLMEKQKIISEKDREEINLLKEDIREAVLEYEKLTGNKLHIKGITDIKQDFSEITKQIKSVNKGITGTVKKIVRWGLAIFGVRSAYLAIRQAMSTLSNENEDMKASIDYIKWALAQVLKPVVEWIINAMIKLLQYVNYIANAWFGINLFANASAKAFKNANGQAKKLQKTMASFDEMNVLSSNNNSSNTGTPWADLSTILSDDEAPAWIRWIARNKDIILTVLGALGVAFAASTINKWISNLKPLLGTLGKGSGLLGLLESIIGIGAIAITIYFVGKILEEARELNEKLKEIAKRSEKLNKEHAEQTEDINDLLMQQVNQRNSGYQVLKDSNDILSKIFGLEDGLLETLKQQVINSGYRIDKEWELWKAGKLQKEDKEKVLDDTIKQIEYNKKIIEKLKQEGIETTALEEINKRLVGYANGMYQEVYNTNEELYDLNNITLKDKELKINIDADTKQAEAKTSSWLEGIAKGMQYLNPANIASKAGSSIGSWIKGLFNAKGALYYPPKLAVGGVINRPGRGIPIGSAIGGERGAEGVIPLTDSQQMALLGEAIGKYINIHLTNVTELDGRTIARKVQEISNNNNFLMNR